MAIKLLITRRGKQEAVKRGHSLEMEGVSVLNVGSFAIVRRQKGDPQVVSADTSTRVKTGDGCVRVAAQSIRRKGDVHYEPWEMGPDKVRPVPPRKTRGFHFKF